MGVHFTLLIVRLSWSLQIVIADFDVGDGGSSIDGSGGWTPQQLIVVMKCTKNAATNALVFPHQDDPKQH